MAIVASGQLTLIDMNDSKQLVSYIGSSQSKTVIYDPNNTVYVPNYSTSNQVLTPQLFIAGTATDLAGSAKSTKWFYQVNGGGTITEIIANGGGYTLGAGSIKTLTISSNVLASNMSMTYICEMVYTDTSTGFDVPAKSEIELVKITNGIKGVDGSGSNAITAFLSNESVMISANSAGTPSSFANSDTQIHLYDGATPLQYDGIGTANGTFKIVATPSGVTVGAITDGGAYAISPVITAMGSDIGSVLFNITGKTLEGTAINVSKSQTFVKVRSGADGTTPTSYTMISSASALQRNISNVYNPLTVTFTAKSQVGTGALANYNARWVIEDTLDNTNWTVRTVNPTTDEATKTYTPSSTTIKAVRVKMYLTGGTSVLLDEQTIPVVADGSNGVSSVVATVWTPDGNTLKNSAGTLTAQIDVFSGTTKVTPSAFKWYIQDPSATAVSGGDADGGAGWRLLNAGYNAGTTNYTTATLTIPASAIVSVESFMCIATYNTLKYRDVCTVIDVTDPIIVTVVGLSTFKNGEGSTTLTARLYRNGAEIDALANEGYTYTWSIYNQAGTKTAFAKTGKTITVNATDIDIRGNVLCEVSK